MRKWNKVKVITIKEPFATLIAEGYKEYEFRTWKTKYRGEILIHAGKGFDKEAMKKFAFLNLNYSPGKIIAIVNLPNCLKIDDEARKMLETKNDKYVYSSVINDKNWDGYGFKLENVTKIKPIEINGKLGLWEYNGSFERQ